MIIRCNDVDILPLKTSYEYDFLSFDFQLPQGSYLVVSPFDLFIARFDIFLWRLTQKPMERPFKLYEAFTSIDLKVV